MTRHFISGIHGACVAATLVALSTGCNWVADPEQPFDNELANTRDALAANDFGTWAAWSVPINVCFEKFTSTETEELDLIPTAAEYASLKTLAMTALGETWGLVPGMAFVNRGSCTSSMQSYLRIVLKWSPCGGGSCGTGVGATCSVGGGLDTQFERDVFKRVLVHEVGHALGAGHEHQRPGNDFVSCEADRVVACHRCKQEIDGGRACAAVDWKECAAGDPILPDPPPTTPRTFSTSSPEHAVIRSMLHNNDTVSNFELLTPYDPLSILNYCNIDNGRAADDFHLTTLDLLGMEMLYPVSKAYPIGCSRGCFHSGTGVITRTDGAITTDFAARGGLNVVMASPVDGRSVKSVSTGDLSTGSSQLTFKFRAPRGQELLSASGNLNNSNAYHTAVLASVL